jgi:hypothetical protein
MAFFIRIEEPLTLDTLIQAIDNETFDYVARSEANYVRLDPRNYSGNFMGVFSSKYIEPYLTENLNNRFLVEEIYEGSPLVCVWAFIKILSLNGFGQPYLNCLSDDTIIVPIKMYDRLKVHTAHLLHSTQNAYFIK